LSTLGKAFLIPKEIVMQASIITPVMREDAARVTSCFLGHHPLFEMIEM